MQQRVSRDGRRSRPLGDTVDGEVGAATVFVFSQEDDRVHARYVGGQVRIGYLVGVCTDTEVRCRYAQVSQTGETATGQSRDWIAVLADGRLRLHETWSWDSRDGSGTSTLDEIGDAS